MIFISILILIVAKALPSINKNITSNDFTRISAIIFLYSGVLSLNTFYIQSIGSGIGIYSGLFQITQVSVLFESFLLLIGSLILTSWPNEQVQFNETLQPKGCSYNFKINTNKMIEKSEDYSLIVLFSSLGSCLLISCFDLISLYISIELQSFGLYVLATLFKESETSTKAGLKYFLLGGLSSCIILLGCGLIYAYTGLTNFESLFSIITTANSISLINLPFSDISETTSVSMPLQGLSLGLILIFIGFLFKIAAAPLHNWSPDVYDEVPTIVTTWLTIIPKIAILILLLELQYFGFTFLNFPELSTINLGEGFIGKTSEFAITNSSIIKNLLLISSLLSLLVGTIVGLAQTRIKRLLAYSTISHIGFILLALAINTESSIDSLIFYVIQYTITNLNIFLIILALSYLTASSSKKNITKNYNNTIKEIIDIRYITELKGKFFYNPTLSLSLAICLFSMAGIPPLIGFFSKQFVLYSAIQNGYYFISIIAILVSVISASYYLKIVKTITYETNQSDNDYIIIDNKFESKIGEKGFATKEQDIKDISLKNQSIVKPKISHSYLSSIHSYLISVLTLSILLFIIKPSLILNSTQLLSLSLFNW